jgi:hypothetical protein
MRAAISRILGKNGSQEALLSLRAFDSGIHEILWLKFSI